MTAAEPLAHAAPRPLVRDVMSRDLLVLRADMRLELAATLLVDQGSSGAPVVDDRGRLYGVLHALDIAAAHLVPLDHRLRPDRPVTVGPLCRRAVTVVPESPVAIAARRMSLRRTDRLIVVSPPRHPVGVLTDHDLLTVVTAAGDLLAEVVSERIADLGYAHVQASAEPTGIVLLQGCVASYEARERLSRQITAIPGVTRVDQFVGIVPDLPDGGGAPAPAGCMPSSSMRGARHPLRPDAI